MAEQWYIRSVSGDVTGPLAERDVSDDLLNGKIDDSQQVKQGLHGNWCDAARARAIFRQLAETGWYVRTGEQIFGPFTDSRLLQLHASQGIAEGSDVRQGLEGPWKPAKAVLSLWQQQKVPTAEPQTGDEEAIESVAGRKWSVEPIRHVVMSLQQGDTSIASQCEPFELLEFSLPGDQELPAQVDSHDVSLNVTRADGTVLGQLTGQNCSQILGNAERGVRHLTLFHSRDEGETRIVVVLCPPGVDAEVCHGYVSDQFQAELPATTT